MKVSNKPIKYPDGSIKKDKTFYHKDFLIYEVRKGEKIKVVLWQRWPSYDYIFGFPAKDNPNAKDEVGFFQYRDTRNKKVKEGFYIDKSELDILIEGFKRIKRLSK